MKRGRFNEDGYTHNGFTLKQMAKVKKLKKFKKDKADVKGNKGFFCPSK